MGLCGVSFLVQLTGNADIARWVLYAFLLVWLSGLLLLYKPSSFDAVSTGRGGFLFSGHSHSGSS